MTGATAGRTVGPFGGAVLVCCLLFVVAAPAGGADTQPAENVTTTVDASAEEVFVSRSVDVTVTVSNGRDEAVRVSGATLVDESGSVRSRLSPAGSPRKIDPGERVEMTFEGVEVVSAGRNRYTARVEVSPDDDPDRGLQSSATVTVTGNDPAPVLDVTPTAAPGPTDRVLTVSLGNANDGGLSRVQVSVQTPPGSDVTVLDRSGAVPVIEPGGTRTVSFDLRGVEAGTQQFRVVTRFETADGDTWNRTERVSVGFSKARVSVPADASPARLTGVSAEGTTPASVSGEVSNTGETPLVGVTVSVADGPGVTPLGTQFLGTVEPGSFSPIDIVRGRIDGSSQTVPVAVGYTIDGTRYRTVFDVERSSGGPTNGGQSIPAPDVDTDSGGAGGDSGSADGGLVSGTSLLLPLGVTGVIVGAAGVFVFVRRR